MASLFAKVWDALRHYNTVVEDYREAAQHAPDSAMAYVNWGIRLSQENQPEEALKKFETAAAMDPERPDVYASWGIALAKLGELDAAIGKFQTAIELDPSDAEHYGLMGAALVESGRLEDAGHTYAQALRMSPNNAGLLVNWGIALARRGDYTEAIQRFQQALKLRKYQPWVYFLWGVILAEQGEYEAAIEKFRTTLRFVPKHAEATLFWCLCLNRLQRYEAAIEVARDGLTLMDDNPEIYLALAEALLHTGNLDAALANARHAVLLDETLAEAYELMGQIYVKQGELAEAIQRFEKALALNPLLVRVHAHWGQALLQAGQTQAALSHLKQAHNADPDNLELLLLWASVAFKAPEAEDPLPATPMQEALGKLFAVAEKEPWHPQLHFLLGSHYLESGDYAKAIDALQRVVQADATHRDAVIQLALAYCGAHQTEEAVRCLRPLVRHYPQDARVLFYYGHMLYRHGEWRQAAEKYAAALAHEPTMTEARIGLAEAQLMQGQWQLCLSTLRPLSAEESRAVRLLVEWATFGHGVHGGASADATILPVDWSSDVADPLLAALILTLQTGERQVGWLDKDEYEWALAQLVATGTVRHALLPTTVPETDAVRYQHPLVVAVLGRCPGHG